MTEALNWFFETMSSSLTALNFRIEIGNYTFGFLDFLVATFLIGLVVRNFVHSAR